MTRKRNVVPEPSAQGSAQGKEPPATPEQEPSARRPVTPVDNSLGLRSNFPVARLCFEAVSEGDGFLPAFAGSVLRGTLGHALRKLVCMTGHPDCPPCPLYRRCPYPEIFAPPPRVQAIAGRRLDQPPVPYVMEPPPISRRPLEEGTPLVFHMLLLGPATARIPHVVEAMRRALAQGLGRRRTRFSLLRVRPAPPVPARSPGTEDPVATGGALPPIYDFTDPDAETAPLDAAIGRIIGSGAGAAGEETGSDGPRPAVTRLRIHHHTPMRLQQGGKIIDHRTLTPRDLLVAAWRRWRLLEAVYGTADGVPQLLGRRLEAAGQMVVTQRKLFWWDWRRHSSRQQQFMTLGGVRGSWEWEGEDLTELLPLLTLGALLHVGKETSFGFGRYEIEATD